MDMAQQDPCRAGDPLAWRLLEGEAYGHTACAGTTQEHTIQVGMCVPCFPSAGEAPTSS